MAKTLNIERQPSQNVCAREETWEQTNLNAVSTAHYSSILNQYISILI